MPRFVSAVAVRGFTCVCGERVRAHERYTEEIADNGRKIKLCRFCQSPDPIPEEPEDDGEGHLRQMEDYAAYRHAGCTEAYWEDRDAGYAR